MTKGTVRFWHHVVAADNAKEANAIMSLRDALEIARSKGVDVILINEVSGPSKFVSIRR